MTTEEWVLATRGYYHSTDTSRDDFHVGGWRCPGGLEIEFAHLAPGTNAKTRMCDFCIAHRLSEDSRAAK